MNHESTYRLIFENSYYGILVVQDGFVRFSNSVVLSITGYSFNDLTLRPVITFAHPDDRTSIKKSCRNILKEDRKPETYHYRIITTHGSVVWLEMRPVPVTWNNRPAFLIFANDITDWIQSRERLEREKETISEECRSAKERLNSMCGDIKEDLDTIYRKCMALCDDLRNIDKDACSTGITDIIENVKHISSMVKVRGEKRSRIS